MFPKNYQSLVSIVILILLLLVSTIVRIPYIFNYPLEFDPQRDFITSKYMVTQGAFPTVGPNSKYVNNFVSSPIYYYLLAPFFIISGDMRILTVVTVILQVFAIVMIFLIGRIWFGTATGLFAAWLFGMNPAMIRFSGKMINPTLSMWFIICAYLFLAYSQSHKRPTLAILGLLWYAIALHIHWGAITALPSMVLLFFLCSPFGWQQKRVKLLLGFIGLLFVWVFLPVTTVFYAYQHKASSSLLQFVEHVPQTIDIFLWTVSTLLRNKTIVEGSILLTLLWIHLRLAKSSNRPFVVRWVAIELSVLLPILAVALASPSDISNYFNPAYPLWFVLIAAAATGFFSGKHKVLCQAIATTFVVTNFFITTNTPPNYWDNAKGVDAMVTRIRQEQEHLHSTKRSQANAFPVYRVFATSLIPDYLIMDLLATQLGVQTMRVIEGGKVIALLGDSEYIFVTCYTNIAHDTNIVKDESACRESAKRLAGYTVEKTITIPSFSTILLLH